MNVKEIFVSIQGEGKYLGVPVIFIRTAGCPVGCPWCDTKEAWGSGSGKSMTKEDIVQELRRIPYSTYKHVVITGGEPTIQPDLYAVAQELKNEQYLVDLETSGFTSQIITGYFNHVVCSPKPALQYAVAKNSDELKFVVNKEFEENAAKYIPGWLRLQYAGRIWLQPMDEGSPESIKENMQVAYRMAMADPRLRVGIQLHKLMEVK